MTLHISHDRRSVLAIVILSLVAFTGRADTHVRKEKSKAPARHDGFLPWSFDDEKGTLLLEVVPGQELLWGSGLAGGAGTVGASLDRGQIGELAPCRFERGGKVMLLERLQTSQRAGEVGPDRTRAVLESFPTALVAAFPIVTDGKERVVVDATAFLKADPFVVRSLKDAEQGEWTQAADLTRIRLEQCGAFPRNTELEAALTFTCAKPPEDFASVLPDGHSMTLRVHHSFVQLPDAGFEVRERDPRVGIFTTGWTEHSRPFTEPIGRRLANRWRLVKRDSSQNLSPPVQPIVFHLDRGIPEPERSAVREAVLWWNHAFEDAGFHDAIEVRDLPEGASLLDARYSGIAWVSRAERAWSIGQSQVDPRTGEILHAVVILDSHRRRTTSRIWRNLAPARGCQAANAPDEAAILANPADAPGVSEQELVLARLRYLAAHEVGHALGLEHDMAATTFGWGSVMDYLGPHVEPAGSGLDLTDAYPKDVGSYDRLAIRWAYTPGADARQLDALVRDGLARGVVFPLDSDARWAEYDWGPDPAAWLRRCLEVRRIVLEQRFGAPQLRDGTPLYELQERFSLACLHHRFALAAAQQNIGGQYQANAVAGDGQLPWSWVPRERQQDCLDAILEAASPETLALPPFLLRSLVPSVSTEPRSREQLASESGDVIDARAAARILANLAVAPLLDPQRASRLSLAPPSESLTLGDVVGRLVATWEPSKPRAGVDPVNERILQRAVLDALLGLAASHASPEARGLALVALEDLRARLRGMRTTDPERRAHVALALRDLASFLDDPAKVQAAVPPPVPPGRPIGARP